MLLRKNMDSKQFRISEMVMDGAFALNFQFSVDEMAKHLKPKLKLPLLKCKSIVEQAIKRGVEDELYVVNKDRLYISLPLDCSFNNIMDKNSTGKNRHKIIPSRQKKRNGLISTKVKRGLFRSGENIGVRKSASSQQEKQHKARRVRVGQERLKKRKSVNHSTRLKSSMKECSLPATQRKESTHTLSKPQSSISLQSKISSKKEISEVTLPSQKSIKNETLIDDSMKELNTNTSMHYDDEELSNRYDPTPTQEWEQNVTI